MLESAIASTIPKMTKLPISTLHLCGSAENHQVFQLGGKWHYEFNKGDHWVTYGLLQRTSRKLISPMSETSIFCSYSYRLTLHHTHAIMLSFH